MLKGQFGTQLGIFLAILCVFGMPFTVYEKHVASKRYRSHRASYCAALVATSEQKKACEEEKAIASDYLPWWFELFEWPEGITAWAIIVTGFVIAWQAMETRKSTAAALQNIAMTKTKERAKFTVAPNPLDPVVGEYAKATFMLTNVGESSAIIRLAVAGLYVSTSDELQKSASGYELKATETVLKAAESTEETAFDATSAFARFSEAVIDGSLLVHLHGVLTYRDAFDDWWTYRFHFIWYHYGVDVVVPGWGKSVTGRWIEQDGSFETAVPKPAAKRN